MPAASLVSCRVSPTDSGHLTPFEAGFSLSSGSDPTKDVILRLEAESNEETKVSDRGGAQSALHLELCCAVFGSLAGHAGELTNDPARVPRR